MKPSSALCIGAAALALAALPARGQLSAGVPLSPDVQLRGPFQHAVVGASVVTESGSLLSSAGAHLSLPVGSRPYLARLFWMGSGDAPDGQVRLRLPGGGTVEVVHDPGSCLLINVGTEADPIRYWQCELDVTDALRALPGLDGEYGIEGLSVDTGAPWSLVQGFVGAFALVIVYVDPADDQPRALQISRGLRYSRGVGGYASSALLPVEMPLSAGRATLVALEGDRELPGDGECTGRLENRTCDFFGLCDADCVDEEAGQLIAGEVLLTLDNAANPPGNIFNETLSAEGLELTGVDAVEPSALDIDTFDLAGRLPASSYPDLRAVVQTGSDAVLQAVLVVELYDQDSDGDGLSDLHEDEVLTDPMNADTDGDGLSDGTELFGGGLLDDTSNPTDPRSPDTDDDGLCDGPADVEGQCVAGEDVGPANGRLDPGETDPRRSDTDRDGLPDALELLYGAYGDPESPRKTSPVDADTDGDGLLDGEEDEDKSGTFEPDRGETDPTVADTDDGGAPDGDEVASGTDPLDPTDDLLPLPDAGYAGERDGGDQDVGPQDAGHHDAGGHDAGASDAGTPGSSAPGWPPPDGGRVRREADPGRRLDPLELTGSTLWSCAGAPGAAGHAPLALALLAAMWRRRRSHSAPHRRPS